MQNRSIIKNNVIVYPGKQWRNASVWQLPSHDMTERLLKGHKFLKWTQSKHSLWHEKKPKYTSWWESWEHWRKACQLAQSQISKISWNSCMFNKVKKNKTSEHYTLTVTVRPLIEQGSRWNITHSVVTEYYTSLQVKVQKKDFRRYHSNFEVVLTNDYCMEWRWYMYIKFVHKTF